MHALCNYVFHFFVVCRNVIVMHMLLLLLAPPPPLHMSLLLLLALWLPMAALTSALQSVAMLLASVVL